MYFHRQLVSLVTAGFMIASGPVPAQQATAQSPAAAPIPLAPDSPPRRGWTLERYFESLRDNFIHLDADRDGIITQRDVDLHILMETVMQRTFAAQFVIRYDLDGDGAVTEDEIRRAERYHSRWSRNDPEKRTDEAVRSIMALDADNDGKVSFAEAGNYTYPRMRQDMGFPELPERTRQALRVKSRTIGQVSWSDYEAAGQARFRKVDTDNDGKISEQEFNEYSRAN